MSALRLQGWSVRTRRRPDGGIVSEQRVLAPRPVVDEDAAGARRLSDRYWAEVERSGLGVLRIERGPDGLALRVRRLPLPPLMRLGALRAHAGRGRVRAAHEIEGGLLVRRGGGSIAFEQRAGAAVELVVTVEGFQPALASRPGAPPVVEALYMRVQLPLHVAISRRYFARLLQAPP